MKLLFDEISISLPWHCRPLVVGVCPVPGRVCHHRTTPLDPPTGFQKDSSPLPLSDSQKAPRPPRCPPGAGEGWHPRWEPPDHSFTHVHSPSQEGAVVNDSGWLCSGVLGQSPRKDEYLVRNCMSWFVEDQNMQAHSEINHIKNRIKTLATQRSPSLSVLLSSTLVRLYALLLHLYRGNAL